MRTLWKDHGYSTSVEDNPHSFWFVWPALLIVIAFAWDLQAHFLLNYDVSWLIHASDRLLQGGTYSQNFFEPNPPLILYIYAPVAIAVHALGINFILSIRIYVFLLAGIALVISWYLSQFVDLGNRRFSREIFIVVLTVVFLIVPLDDFGQREHLAVLFTLPYFLLISIRLTDSRIRAWLAFGIGIWASLGFFLKPHFLMPLIAVELFFVLRRVTKVKITKRFPWHRTELWGLGAVGLIYGLCIWLFHADYLSVVIPISSRFYFIGNQQPVTILLKNYPLIYCGSVAFLVFFQGIKTTLKPLTLVLCVAMIGYAGGHLLGLTNWYYHTIPCFSLAFITLWLLVSDRLNAQPTLNWILFNFFVGAYFTLVPLIFMSEICTHVFKLDAEYQRLITFAKKNSPHQSVYFFEVIAKNAYPLVDYVPTTSVSRVAALGWLRGLVKQAELPMTPAQKKQLVADQAFMMQMTTEDIEKQKPALIFINSAISFKLPSLSSQSFDFLTLFLQHQAFKTVWGGYEYFATVNDYQVYRRKLSVVRQSV